MTSSDGTADRPLVLPLRDCATLSISEVGAKARTLGLLMASGLPVPQGVCLTTTALRRTLSASGVDEAVDEHLAAAELMPATLGARLAAIRSAVRAATLPVEVRRALGRAAEELLLLGPVVVRSSSPGEDGSTAAAAGVYDSVRDVVDTDSLVRAVQQVWASLFTERVNYYQHGRLVARMAVVLQTQVPADHSGVLFTRHPVNGRSGFFNETSATPEGVTAGTQAELVAASPELRLLAHKAERVVGSPIDIEYASTSDGPVILQARPITSATRPQVPRIQGYQWAAQEDVQAVRALPLGSCATLFMRQLVKHVPYRQLCRSLGIPIYDIYYLAYRWNAITPERLAPFLNRLQTERVSVNWGTGSEPPIPTGGLLESLWAKRKRNVVGEETSCVRIGTMVPARIAGSAAALSDGRTLIEAFPPGADPAASAVRYLLDSAGRVDDVVDPGPGRRPMEPTALERIGEILRLLGRHLGEVRLEWYVSDDNVHVKDLSIEREPLRVPPQDVLSPGLLQGPALVLDNVEELVNPVIAERVSVVEHEDPDETLRQVGPLRRLLHRIKSMPQPPVVVANFPALGLIPVAPHVAGFVFERGNLLCHTAIVLREKRVPAVVVPGAVAGIPDGQFVRMGREPAAS